jgi:hypothetical protein
VTLTMLFDAMINHNAGVVYAAGEGAYGVRQFRVPAHYRARGFPHGSLDDPDDPDYCDDEHGSLVQIPAVPLFADHSQVAEFIEELVQGGPASSNGEDQTDIIVIDTLATAITGCRATLRPTARLAGSGKRARP